MDLWKQVEALLSRFENTESSQRELRALTAKIPPTLYEMPAAERERVSEIAAEALYQAGDLERLVAWMAEPVGAGTALWIGHALFDLNRYLDALPYLERAVAELPLQDGARLKIDELILCIIIRCEPGRVSLDDFQRLDARHRSLGVDAPVPIELREALAEAEDAGSLPIEHLRFAKKGFGP